MEADSGVNFFCWGGLRPPPDPPCQVLDWVLAPAAPRVPAPRVLAPRVPAPRVPAPRVPAHQVTGMP